LRELREPGLVFGQSQASARTALGGTPFTGYTTRTADDTGPLALAQKRKEVRTGTIGARPALTV
jgi:hypothetical protein